jgi:ACS family tartrate transporter-like MFS transporter
MLMIPSLIAIAGMLFNGAHSDKTRERRWHVAIPLIVGFRGEVSIAIVFLLLGTGVYYACQPVFWAIPTQILSETAAAASFGLINTFGQIGGFVGAYINRIS